MWLDSKKAAEILGIKYDALQKATNRATKKGKKFCRIRFNIINFNYIDGNIGGASGKTLQIWIDDDLINDKNSEISRADKASAVNLVNTAVRPLNFTNGESDGYIYADTKLDARDSVDIRGANGGVFGGGLANTGDRRDQEQTQINLDERMNDGDMHRAASTDVYDTCAGSETNRSPLPIWQINEQGEASAYIKAHAGDGLHQCEGNPVHELRFQAGSEEQRGANEPSKTRR